MVSLLKTTAFSFALLITTFALQAQSILSITPNSAAVGDQVPGAQIVGQGTNFMAGSATGDVIGVNLKQAGTVINASSFNIQNDSMLDADFSIPVATPVGFYDVNVVTNTQGTLTLTGGFFISLVGIEAIQPQTDITVYPNPAINDIQVSVEGSVTPKVTAQIFDVKGSLLATQTFQNISNNAIQMDIAQHPAGIYFIQLRTDDGKQFVKKFVIEK